MGLKKIISSGQMGAEQGALASAFKNNCPTGGLIPKGYKVNSGFDPTLSLFNLTESENVKLGDCVVENIKISNGTIVFIKNIDKVSVPEEFAKIKCGEIGKSCLVYPLDGSVSVNAIRIFLKDHNISYLHVTGGQDSSRTKYMFNSVFNIIDKLLETLITETKYDKTRDNFITANKG